MGTTTDISTSSRALEQRRCLILAAVGSTAETTPNNPTLKNILNAGFLVKVKSWLDEILDGSVGGMDLLLHLLTNISPLPVTKEMVTSSRLGKAVAALEKHKICVGSLNETSIKNRVRQVKESWSASVKAQKNQQAPQSSMSGGKRQLEEHAPTATKKSKRESAASSSSLSNLLKKVENVNNNRTVSAAESARLKAQERDAKLKERLGMGGNKTDGTKVAADGSGEKDKRHIRWADDSGKALAVPQENGATLTTDIVQEKATKDPRRSSWTDRKKKDLLHEKELLLQARKLDSLDDDKEDMLNAMSMMVMPWKIPALLPEDTANLPVQVMSNEITTQANRMASVAAVRYSSENGVPVNPTVLSDIEKALELSSRNTSAPGLIPFFTPKEVVPNTINQLSSIPPAFPPPPAILNAVPSSEATLETCLAMGLPLFLVGCHTQALQTLAAAPELLNTFKDANGVYDQPRLMNLVKTLTQNIAPAQSSQTNLGFSNSTHENTNNYYQSTTIPYAPPVQSFGTTTNTFSAPATPAQPHQPRGGGGYRGDQNIGEANLHLSGYGPGTTDSDIINLFAPYVHVVEVVQKGSFSFVNTMDPIGAAKARECLNGALLGGMPVRINIAARKAKKPMSEVNAMRSNTGTLSLPRNNLGQVDFAQVRDDRGNPSTKNLFIAGYGPGTTEQQLRELVAQHANVISVVMKGTFAFVNTSDKDAAVLAREALMGFPLNGGPLRINFAKESGRLGTSFDQTYGPSGGGPNHGRFR